MNINEAVSRLISALPRLMNINEAVSRLIGALPRLMNIKASNRIRFPFGMFWLESRPLHLFLPFWESTVCTGSFN